MLALIEVVFVVALAPTFGIDTNPQAPSVRDIARYAPASPDLTFYVDVGAVFPRNYKAFEALAKSPLVQDTPSFRDAVANARSKVEFGRSFVENALGFDPLTDIEAIALWVSLGPTEDQDEYVLVAHGHWPSDLIARIAKLAGKQTTQIHGHTALSMPDEDVTFALPERDVLLIAMPAAAEARLSPSWKPSRLDPRLARLFRKHPALLLASSPSAPALARWKAALADEDEVLRAMLLDHEMATVALTNDDLSVAWHAHTQLGYERAVLMGHAIADLTRSMHLMLRGLGWVALAGTSASFDDPILRSLSVHRHELRRLMIDLLGKGDIRSSVAARDRKRAVRVHLRGTAVDTFGVWTVGFAVAAGLYGVLEESGNEGAFVP